MNRRLKFAFAALLGFSSACSTVKKAPANGAGTSADGGDTLKIETPMRVMYGVLPPREVKVEDADSIRAVPVDTLPRLQVMYGVRNPDGSTVVRDEEASVETPAGK